MLQLFSVSLKYTMTPCDSPIIMTNIPLVCLIKINHYFNVIIYIITELVVVCGQTFVYECKKIMLSLNSVEYTIELLRNIKKYDIVMFQYDSRPVCNPKKLLPFRASSILSCDICDFVS